MDGNRQQVPFCMGQVEAAFPGKIAAISRNLFVLRKLNCTKAVEKYFGYQRR